LAELNNAYVSAEDDLERAMLWSQIRGNHRAFTRGPEELISQTEKLEAFGQDTRQSRTDSRTLITRLTASLEKGIVQGQQRILDLREQRASASTGDLAALDKEIGKSLTALDEGLTTFFELTQMLEAQAGDPGASEEEKQPKSRSSLPITRALRG
jgi:hypothetical protein